MASGSPQHRLLKNFLNTNVPLERVTFNDNLGVSLGAWGIDDLHQAHFGRCLRSRNATAERYLYYNIWSSSFMLNLIGQCSRSYHTHSVS